MPLAWLWTSYALAQGYSLDIELLDPSFGARAIPGVDAPTTDRAGAVRFGSMVQYQADPLTLYDAVSDVELGAVVAERATAAFGVSADLTGRFTVDLSLPTAASWQSEVPEFAGDGFGAGDPALGAQLVVVRTRAFALGARGAARLPLGRSNAWLGERGVRVQPALLASVELGPVTVATDVGTQLRPPIATTEDLSLGSELVWASGARVALPDASRLALSGSVLARAGLSDLGAGETPLELLAGVQVRPTRDLTVDLGGGRGLTEGYGTTNLRLMSAVTWRFRPRDEPEVGPGPPPPPPPPPERPHELVDREDPPDPDLPRLTETTIEIPEQPRFIVDTPILLDSARPLLLDVAALLEEHPELTHVVIVGHASEEGTEAHNYDLSLRRAHAIWQALVAAGVDEARLSFRARGEADPLVPGTSAEALEANRRVEFLITGRAAVAPGP